MSLSTAITAVNPFGHLEREIVIDGTTYTYFDIAALGEEFGRLTERLASGFILNNLFIFSGVTLDRLPFSIRVLLESAVRNCDQFHVLEKDVRQILEWRHSKGVENDTEVEVSFKPARVILQDFTGVPAVVDFAAMRDAVLKLGGDPNRINPICPSDLVIDHSVQVDFSGA